MRCNLPGTYIKGRVGKQPARAASPAPAAAITKFDPLGHIPTAEGPCYLAIVLDLASRRVIGWAIDEGHAVGLPLNALAMALSHRTPVAGALHHSDRGSEYTSAAYQAALAAHGLTPSMSGTRNCYDNAVAESFFATLEQELLLDTPFPTRFAARRAIIQFIEIWYNCQRRHSSIGMISPARYEAQRAA